MDNITHSLTGLMLARTGFGKWTPRAGFLMILAANIPDADIVSGLAGRAQYLDIHRGYTHSWALLPVMALLAAAVARWSLAWPVWAQRVVGGREALEGWSWWKAWVAAMVAVASHLLLDWTNNYGIRFGVPFEGAWHRLDLMFIVDPWVWLLLLFGVCAPFLSRLVSSEMGAKQTSGTGVAWFVLLMITAYLGGRYMAHQQVIGLLNSRVYENQTPRRVAAFPTFGNPLRWRVLAELDASYWISEVNLIQDFDPAEGRVFYQSTDRSSMAKASATRDFQVFLRFNPFPLWRTIPLPGSDGGVKVDLFDLRFGDPVSPGFVATAVVENGHAEQESIQFGTPKI